MNALDAALAFVTNPGVLTTIGAGTAGFWAWARERAKGRALEAVAQARTAAAVARAEAESAPAAQAAIDAAVAGLMKHYMDALAEARQEMIGLRAEIQRLGGQLETQGEEMETLREHLDKVEGLLREHGVEPPRPARRATPARRRSPPTPQPEA